MIKVPDSLLWGEQMKGLSGLFIVATPIGHLEDISLRALQTLQGVDAILCEDTRVTRQLLQHYHLRVPCTSYHGHNERQKLESTLAMLKSGKKLALVSDRGTPLISDPGTLLVQSCIQEGIPVHSLPGASSVLLAVTLSGFPTSSFFFQGFLPQRHIKRQTLLHTLVTLPCPLIFFESPYRIHACLSTLLQHLGNRRACILRELTKKFEERKGGTLMQLSQEVEHNPLKGEITIVVEGAICP